MKAYPRYELKQITDLRHLMELRAAETPDDTAFFFTDDKGVVVQISCRAFYDDVRALGTYLLSEGFKGEHVGLLGANSYEWLVVFFALTTTGNVAVPLDARVPVQHLTQIMKYGDSRRLFYSAEFEPAMPAFSGAIREFEGFPLKDLGEAIGKGREKL